MKDFFTGTLGCLFGIAIFIAVITNLFVMGAWMGWGGVILGIFIFPIMIAVAPFYALFYMDWWAPILLTFGPWVVIGVVALFSNLFSDD